MFPAAGAGTWQYRVLEGWAVPQGAEFADEHRHVMPGVVHGVAAAERTGVLADDPGDVSPQASFMSEIFGTGSRYSGASLGCQLSAAISGPRRHLAVRRIRYPTADLTKKGP